MAPATLQPLRHCCFLAVVASIAGCGSGKTEPAAQAHNDVSAAEQTAPSLSQTESEPPLECAEPTWALGTVDAGTNYDHVFVLKNPGEQAVEILRVVSECGCSVIGDYESIVEPGANLRIPVRFRATDDPGPINKRITVVVRSPKEQSTTLLLSANVKKHPTIFIGMPSVGVGVLVAGEERAISVPVGRHDGSALDYVGFKSDSDSVRVNAPPSATDLSTITQVPVRIDSTGLKLGPFALKVTIETSRKAPYRSAEFVITGRVVPAGAGEFVERVFVKRLEPHDPETVSLCGGPDVTKVSDVTFSGSESLQVTLLPKSEIQVVFTKDVDKPTVVRGTLKVNLSEAAHELQIPLLAIVMPTDK